MATNETDAVATQDDSEMHVDNASIKNEAQASAHDNNEVVRDDQEDHKHAPTDDTSSSMWEVVRAKYFFAGGSARFMFQFHMRKLKAELDERLGQVSSTDWTSFTQEHVSLSTPASVNALMQRFKGKCTPLSKYVLFCAYEKCRSELVRAVRAVANKTNNPSLKGWAFELEQIDLIHSSLVSGNSRPEYVTNEKGLVFRPTSQTDFDDSNLSGDVVEGAVVWCMKWNQGCFDVAFYQNGTLITLQFTIQATHSLQLQSIRKLRTELKSQGNDVRRVVHIGVREGGEWDVFQFGRADGTGRQSSAQDQPEFTIDLYRSPPLTKDLTGGFSCHIQDVTKLSTENMWKVGGRKRIRSQD